MGKLWVESWYESLKRSLNKPLRICFCTICFFYLSMAILRGKSRRGHNSQVFLYLSLNMSDIISSLCTAIVPLFSHSSRVWLVIYARCQAVNYDLLVVMNVPSVSTCLLQQKHVFSWVVFSVRPIERKFISQKMHKQDTWCSFITYWIHLWKQSEKMQFFQL